MKYNTVVVSGFPGTGKSYFTDKYDSVKDSDSSKFDKEEFPQNYIDHIKGEMGKHKIIFISSHKEVRDALVKNDIPFTLVYPERSLKWEYLSRYKNRGSTDTFIQLVLDNWYHWMDELNSQEGCKHIVLDYDEFMLDIQEKLI